MGLTLRSLRCSLLFLFGCAGAYEDTMRSATNLAASARDYPAKPVRIIEPFGAGGGPDLLARALAPKLSELWGQPVTVENIPGAGATAGPAQVAKSPADGYTLLINTNASWQARRLVSVGGLIAAAKAKPGELKFGSTGIGTGTHVVEKFNQAAGIKALHVPPSPNNSNADTNANAIAMRFIYYLVPISLALPHIHDGTLVALGVSTARRSTLLPEVPIIAEASVVSFDFPISYGMWAPAGSPTGVVEKLSNDIGRVLTGPDLCEWIAKHGGEPMSMTQPEFVRSWKARVKLRRDS